MRRTFAIGTLGLLTLLGAVVVGWAEEATPQGGAPAQAQNEWGNRSRQFGGSGQGRYGTQGGPGGPGRGWQRGGRRGFGEGGGLLRMAENPRVREYLSLSDEQVERLHKLGLESEKTSVQARADMQLRRIELRELLRADNPDHDAIMKKLDEVNALRGKMEKQRMETMLSARSVLTPDQQKKLKTFRQNRGFGDGQGRGRSMERRGGMGRPGGPGNPSGGSSPKPPEPPTE